MFQFIRLGRSQRRPDHLTHTVGKPALQTNVHSQPGKNSDGDSRHQSQQREGTDQTQVQPGSGRFRAPGRHQTAQLAQHQCGHNKDIDQIGKQNQAQRRRGRPKIKRTNDKIGGKRQHWA